MTMGCCGELGPTPLRPPTLKQEGDVLVKCQWAGNKTFHGRVSGRDYPYNGNGKLAWIDPRDQQASPDLFPLVKIEVQAAKQPEPSSLVIIESTGGVSQEWRGTTQTLGAENPPDNFQMSGESAVSSEVKPKRSRSKKTNA
jgi:hypothetical protein